MSWAPGRWAAWGRSPSRSCYTTCIAGLRWNEGNVRRNLEGSVGAAVEASALRGYDSVAAELRSLT